MSNPITVYTTTFKNEHNNAFDIFQWSSWLYSATLADLYIARGEAAVLRNLHYRRMSNSIGTASPRYHRHHKQLAEFYATLHDKIHLEITHREHLLWYTASEN